MRRCAQNFHEFQELDPLYSNHGGDVMEAQPDPSGAAFPAAEAAQEIYQWDFCQGGNVATEGYSAATAQYSFELRSGDCLPPNSMWSGGDNCLSISSNYHLDERMALSQPVSGQGMEHGRTNYESSEVVPCLALLQDIGDRDGIQCTSGGNIEREELESDGVPKVRMEFESDKEAYDFYKNYAKQKGFKVRKGKILYSRSKSVTGKWFHCSEHNFNKLTHDNRTACEAKIKCAVKDGKWRIVNVSLEHNHGLKGRLAGVQEGTEDSPVTMRALSTGKNVDGLTHISNVDCSDVSRGREKNHDLTDQFHNRQMKHPSFFYAVQHRVQSGMANFFWRDDRSMGDYEHFGDVLVLDTRTRINDGMICAVFWGLNHHRQRIIFGCAILVNQTVSSFSWLLESFLEAMGWKEPKTIITEISEEIAVALRRVLPRTPHCLPYWSILNSNRTDVGNLFSECIFNVQSPEEFESKWFDLVAKHRLNEDAWITYLYGMREKWSHAFTKYVFSGGLLSIQNDEHARPLFENISWEAMTTLSQIVRQCEKLTEDTRIKEDHEDKHCEKNNPADLKTPSVLEEKAQRLYTRSIFEMFQNELINTLSLALTKSGSTQPATLLEWKLTKVGSTNIAIVKFNPSNSTLKCTCGKFESIGILCFHALKVLNHHRIFSIPSRHLLKRWMKSAKNSDNQCKVNT